MAKKKREELNHLHVGILAVASILLSVAFLAQHLLLISAKQANKPATGFDEFGYNYVARTFSGKADGVDRNLDGSVWGDAKYGNDHLKMTWSKGWDDARFNGADWTCSAWEDNQWNGSVPNGSGENWHYKIVWVGPELQNSTCWHEGGDPIWGQFEIIMSQGSVDHQHFNDLKAKPAGYGVFK